MRLNVAVAAVALIVLGGCASPQMQSPPPGPASAPHLAGRSALLDHTDHMTGHLNGDKTILLFQNFGGGGAGLGLLAGPFGVMANISMIEEVTKSEVAKLNGRLNVDPVQAFREAAIAEGLHLAATGPGEAAILSPYLYVTKPRPETIAFASALLVDYAGASPRWTGKYMHQLTTTLASETAEESLRDERVLGALKAETVAGMRALVRLYLADAGQRLAVVRKVKFTSDFVSPRFAFELAGDELKGADGRVTIRTVGGVYALVPETVVVSAQ